ncbi:hypothetical protein OEB99_06255 [Actinotalea sp. M2MS4P-6]|uniref:hypothetical protein n=1 Tax=Actinotalea sp. M2MS4P-6 TaxID=2983762 RepID=UPI0021E35AB0|nr:hypothetical protein [Actinotalea sp. M2MS4P-6]MCV2393904.1 hypothetical protein [Actinotalea sp. M2MS4P-6]
MTMGAQDLVDAIVEFFAQREVASLELPSGWFGRPHDNLHRLTGAATSGDEVRIELDGTQRLNINPIGARVDGRVLRIEIARGTWVWTEYGGDRKHTEALTAGTVQFHAAWAPG